MTKPSRESLEKAEKLMVLLGAKIRFGETKVGEVYEFLAEALDSERMLERERCAKIADSFICDRHFAIECDCGSDAYSIAKAIRANKTRGR